MIPFWSHATDEHIAARIAAQQRDNAEHQAALARIAEAAQTDDGVTQPSEDPEPVPTKRCDWDGPTWFGPIDGHAV